MSFSLQQYMLPKTERTGPSTSAAYITYIIRTSINVYRNIPFLHLLLKLLCTFWSTNARRGSVITEPYSTITVVATPTANKTLIDKPRYTTHTPQQEMSSLRSLLIPPMIPTTSWWIGGSGGLSPEAEFLDDIQTKFLRVFLLAVQSHLYSFALRFLFLQTHRQPTPLC